MHVLQFVDELYRHGCVLHPHGCVLHRHGCVLHRHGCVLHSPSASPYGMCTHACIACAGGRMQYIQAPPLGGSKRICAFVLSVLGTE
jgi:hypothetical protein